jgi:hypothetical protein
MALGSTQFIIEMSTRNLPGSKGWPALKADNLPPSVSRLSICGSLDVSQTYGPSRAVTGTALSLVQRPVRQIIHYSLSSNYPLPKSLSY